MLGKCKFCVLFDNDIGIVTYENIVEAIMQIAINLTSKHNAGKSFFHGIPLKSILSKRCNVISQQDGSIFNNNQLYTLRM